MPPLLRYLYAVWGLTTFALTFLALLPFFLFIIPFPSLHHFTHQLNKVWAWFAFRWLFIPVTVEWRFNPSASRRYVFTPNHFSYLDIPVCGLAMKHYAVFVGKMSLTRLPLFGYMFDRLHISVDRSRLRAKYQTFERAKQALAQGKNIIIFPEGGMVSQHPPLMGRFKDGAFRMAIEQQVHVVPVTIPYNWLILHDEHFASLRWHPAKIILHEPIDTTGMTIADLDRLKEAVRQVMEKEIQAHFPLTHPAAASSAAHPQEGLG